MVAVAEEQWVEPATSAARSFATTLLKLSMRRQAHRCA
jgi:hypothetical protein